MLLDLLLELLRINFLRCALRFYFRMIFTEAGIQKQRFLRDGFLIIRQNFLQREVGNVERRQHPHELFALKFLDLFELALERRHFRLGIVHFDLLLAYDVIDRRLRVFRPFGVKIDNVF